MLDGKVSLLDGKVSRLDGKVSLLDRKVSLLDRKVGYLMEESLRVDARRIGGDRFAKSFIFHQSWAFLEDQIRHASS